MSELSQVYLAARECLEKNLPHAQTMSLAREIRKLDTVDEFRLIRLSVLSSSNLDFLAPFLEVTAFTDRILLKTQNAGFNQIDQYILDPSSPLYLFSPNFALIAARPEDIVPNLAHNLELVDDQVIDGWIDEIRTKLNTWCASLTKAKVQIIFLSFARPAYSPLGIRDFSHPKGHVRIWNRLNEILAEVVGQYQGINVVDFEGLVRRVGLLQWEDPKLWRLAKISGGARFASDFVGEIMPFLRESAGRRRKCLVLDLDNTLWGGIIGEDGIAGVKLGGDYPGNVYQEFQRRIIELWKGGVMLAINSKNNQADAEEMINNHPEMLLNLNHFVSRQINWVDKVENIKSIAKQINIGLDSIVFIDDNPVECERVSKALPQVNVFQVPYDLAQLPRQFEVICKFFDGVTVSEEDRQRNLMYQQNQLRQAQMSTVSSVEEFLCGLEMTAEVEFVNNGNLSRVVQLLHKTNQFNVTTRRHSEQFIAALMTSPSWLTYAVRLKDKFGDNGIVLIALVELNEKIARLDTFLMSCRVIGRSLESTVIRVIADDLLERGVDVLVGEYIPTAKNNMVSDLFPKLGFVPSGQTEFGRSYILPIKESDSKPGCITIKKFFK